MRAHVGHVGQGQHGTVGAAGRVADRLAADPQPHGLVGRARERPVPRDLQELGRAPARPVRSVDHRRSRLGGDHRARLVERVPRRVEHAAVDQLVHRQVDQVGEGGVRVLDAAAAVDARRRPRRARRWCGRTARAGCARCSVSRTRSSRSRVTASTTSRVRGSAPGGTSASTWWRLSASSAGSDRVVGAAQRDRQSVRAVRGDLVDQQAPSLGAAAPGPAGRRRRGRVAPRSSAELGVGGGVRVLDAAVGGVEDPDAVLEVLDERSDQFARGCQHLTPDLPRGGRRSTPATSSETLRSRAPWSVDGGAPCGDATASDAPGGAAASVAASSWRSTMSSPASQKPGSSRSQSTMRPSSAGVIEPPARSSSR